VRVLVVEDEALLARQLTMALGDAGYAVDCAEDGERADLLGRTEHYDAVILDLGLPKIDGLTLLRRWRDAGLGMPVLILTARGSWHEKVQGIDGGADDYVSKPFRMEEVLARLRALIRRASGQITPEPRIPRALLPDAPSRPHRLAKRAHRTHLRAELRSRLEHGGSVHRAPAP
jgi:two-component system OmpR family response regulator